MCVSQKNKRIFLMIGLGIFLVSGCSGHSVKYGANSEGEEMASEENMVGSVDGSTMHGGTVDENSGSLRSGQGTSKTHGDMNSEMPAVDGMPSGPGGGSDYGRQFGGVNGKGPNQGSVNGFGSGSANASTSDPEAWANAYLREKRSSQGFYGDPSSDGSSSDGSSYGQDSTGVSGSEPKYGAVDGFSQDSASSADPDPAAWAQAYVRENGGSSPEYVKPETDIALASRGKDAKLVGKNNSKGELLEISNTSHGFQGRVQDIYFAFDSWNISTEGGKYLEEDAAWLHANPEKGLTIEGHCDQRGTQDYNLVLGKKRAEAAREYLVNLGVQPHRLKIVSYGKERPFCQNNNEQCFQENRRNHMVVRMNQS